MKAHYSFLNDKPLVIIVGGSELPKIIVDQLVKMNIKHKVIVIKGHGELNSYQNSDKIEADFSQIGTMIKYILADKSEYIAMVGTVTRPLIANLSLDEEGQKFVAGLDLDGIGDDELFSTIIERLKSLYDLRILPVHEIAPFLLADREEKTLTKTKLKDRDKKDLWRAREVLKALGRVDVGQALIIQRGMILGLEAIEGTEKLISRCLEYQRAGEGSILVKARKVSQDLRIDLPTVGPQTIISLVAGKMSALVIEAGYTIMVNKSKMIEIADKNDFVIHIMPSIDM